MFVSTMRSTRLTKSSRLRHFKVGAAVIAATLLPAQGALGQATAERPWLSGLYTIDPYHTSAQFEWRHFDISNVSGRFDKVAGTISIDTKSNTGSIEVTIPVSSVSTGIHGLDTKLLSDEFFDVIHFPTITFKSSAFHLTDGELRDVPGDLTIHGVSHPVVLHVNGSACKEHRNPNMMLPACGANAVLTINRSDYDMGSFIPFVSDRIDIRINVEAIKGAEGIEGQFPGKRATPQ